MSQQRSEGFIRAGVEKFRSRGSRSVEVVAQVLGVSSWSVYQRAKRYGNDAGMNTYRRPTDQSAEEKLKEVIEFEEFEGDKLGEYLCREGLYSDHVGTWKKNMDAGRESGRGDNPTTRMERAQDKRKIKELEK
jgi:hypothetical protein